MLTPTIILLTYIITTHTQTIEIQDLTNNNGYINIKLENIQIVDNYTKILHIINLTEYQIAKDNILDNLNALHNKKKTNSIIQTTIYNYKLLENKLNKLLPYNRKRRGLFNGLGKGLKFITGTMDSTDADEIYKELELLKNNKNDLYIETNKQIIINNQLINQIKNLTHHINSQQLIIKDSLEKETNAIHKLEHEIYRFEYIYQINYNIDLLRNHIDEIEQIILTSKLGILSRNILTDDELHKIPSIEALANIKITLANFNNEIVVILLVPNFSNKNYFTTYVDSLPNKFNKTLNIDITKEIIVDENNNVYMGNVKDNYKNNLIEIKDECIRSIFKSKNVYCNMKDFNENIINEIKDGLVITKNIKETKINHNCNKSNITVIGTKLIKFENCKIEIDNITYTNNAIKIKDHLILPNYYTPIKENKNNTEIIFKKLHLEKIVNNRQNIEEIMETNSLRNIVNISLFSGTIIIATLLLVITVYNHISNKRVKFIIPSSEPQTKGGGVISSISII